MQDYFDQLESIRSSLTLSEDSAVGWGFLGMKYHIGNQKWHRSSHNQEALACFDISLQYLDPSDHKNIHEVQVYRGVTLEHMGRPEEALESFDRAEQVATSAFQRAVVTQYRGSALALLHRFDEATVEYRRSLSFNRFDSVTYMGLTSSLLNNPCVVEWRALVHAGRETDALPSHLACRDELGDLVNDIRAVVEELDPNIQVDIDVDIGVVEDGVVEDSTFESDDVGGDESSASVSGRGGGGRDVDVSVDDKDPNLGVKVHRKPLNVVQSANKGVARLTAAKQNWLATVNASADAQHECSRSGNGGVFDQAAPFHYSIFQLADALQWRDVAWRHLQLAHCNDFASALELDDVHLSAAWRKFRNIASYFRRGFWPPLSLGLGDNTTTPVFIVGFPRSGSTLLESMLASHPQITTIGELSVLNTHINELLSAYSEIASHPLEAVDEEEDGEATADSRMRRTMAPYTQWTNARASSIVEDMFATARNMSNGSESSKHKSKPNRSGHLHVIDKMLGNYFHIGLIHLLFPKAVILHIHRDPMDVLWSCFQRKFQSPHLSYTASAAMLVQKYTIYLQMMQHWRLNLPPGRLVEVSYESLIAVPETVMRNIVSNHLQLPWDQAVLRHQDARRGSIAMTASMFQVRQQIYNTSVGTWRQYADYLSPVTATPPAAVPVLQEPSIQHLLNASLQYSIIARVAMLTNNSKHLATDSPLFRSVKQSLLPASLDYNWRGTREFSYEKLLLTEKCRLYHDIWTVDLLSNSKGNYPKLIINHVQSSNHTELIRDVGRLLTLELLASLPHLAAFLNQVCGLETDGALLDCLAAPGPDAITDPAPSGTAWTDRAFTLSVMTSTTADDPPVPVPVPVSVVTADHELVSPEAAEYIFSLALVLGRHLVVNQNPLHALRAYALCAHVYSEHLRGSGAFDSSSGSQRQILSVLAYHQADAYMLCNMLPAAALLFRASISTIRSPKEGAEGGTGSTVSYRAYVSILKDLPDGDALRFLEILRNHGLLAGGDNKGGGEHGSMNVTSVLLEFWQELALEVYRHGRAGLDAATTGGAGTSPETESVFDFSYLNLAEQPLGRAFSDLVRSQRGSVTAQHQQFVGSYWSLHGCMEKLTDLSSRIPSKKSRSKQKRKKPDSNTTGFAATTRIASIDQFNDLLGLRNPAVYRALGWKFLQQAHSVDLVRLYQVANSVIHLHPSSATDSRAGPGDLLAAALSAESDGLLEYIGSVFRSYSGYYPSPRKYGTIGSSSQTPVFIVGSYRSGSTLLETLLTAHRNIGSVGENSVFASELLISTNFNVLELRNTSEVVRHKAGIREYAELVVDKMVAQADSARVLQAQLSAFISGNSTPSARPPLRHVVDKSLINYRNIGWIHLLYPKALIVHIYRRNFMDTLWSCYRQRFDAMSLAYTQHPETLVREYILYVRVMDHFRSILAQSPAGTGRLLDVAYEDLVSDPESVLRDLIVGRLRLPWDPNVLRVVAGVARSADAQDPAPTGGSSGASVDSRIVYTASMFQVKRSVYNSSIGSWQRFSDALFRAANASGAEGRSGDRSNNNAIATTDAIMTIETEMERYLPALHQMKIHPFYTSNPEEEEEDDDDDDDEYDIF